MPPRRESAAPSLPPAEENPLLAWAASLSDEERAHLRELGELGRRFDGDAAAEHATTKSQPK
jgi:hypothetical protein